MLSYNNKKPNREYRKQDKGNSDLSCYSSYKQEHSFLLPASTPTGKKETETLQLNYFETSIILLSHPNSSESRAAFQVTAISPTLGQAWTQDMCSSFIWNPETHQVETPSRERHWCQSDTSSQKGVKKTNWGQGDQEETLTSKYLQALPLSHSWTLKCLHPLEQGEVAFWVRERGTFLTGWMWAKQSIFL